MSAVASAFSNFASMPQQNETLNVVEVVELLLIFNENNIIFEKNHLKLFRKSNTVGSNYH
jgi:hypothetical protein